MNVVSITRKPQALPTTPCPICRKPAQIMGRIGEPKGGRMTPQTPAAPAASGVAHTTSTRRTEAQHEHDN